MCCAPSRAMMATLLLLAVATVDGYAQNPKAGIWISPAELAQLKMEGVHWQRLKIQAQAPAGLPNLSDQDQNNDVYVLAKALVYAWTFGDGATSTEPNPTYTCIAAGTHAAQLTVTDNAGTTDEATVLITVTAPVNEPPVMDAGPDQTITLPASADLVGVVTDDGWLISPPMLTWSQVRGPGPVTFGSPTAANTTATFSAVGSYVLRLSASDGQFTVSDDVIVLVNAAPMPPTIASFTTTPDSIAAGRSAALEWTTTDATSAAMDNGVGSELPAVGSTVVSPAATATYTLTATGPGRTTTRTVTVNPVPPEPPPSEMPVNFKVAFIGDTAAGHKFRRVLRLIKRQGAHMVLHQGDLGYTGKDTSPWESVVNEVLGANFPYFALAGNHDTGWSTGYGPLLAARAQRVGAVCTGNYGLNSACYYQGLFFILSAGGETGTEAQNTQYIRDQLAQDHSLWRICAWHRTRRLMQVGHKDDEVGWGLYEACREGGAIIATAHEHSYSRTHLMENFQTQKIISTSNTLQIEKGKSFAFVSGLGGKSIRDQELDGPWWAAIYTATQGANYGALFCTFNVNGVADHASCYFMDIDGNIPDRFEVISAVQEAEKVGEMSTPAQSCLFVEGSHSRLGDSLFHDQSPCP